uniref:LexA repressor n=1 Tax=uncultured bacterium W4-21b TaxID=1130993 RepID=H9BWP7_9BACT|nr:LexA repressor [uncultured bacterium W4-21b]
MSRQIDFSGVLSKLRTFYARQRRLPSFSEIQSVLGYKSKGGVSRLVAHLVERGIIEQDSTGRLRATAFFQNPLRVLGSIQAGFPSPAEEELVDTLSLDKFLIRNPEASYLVKVTGDSMIGAGILAGDLVIVERGKEPSSGDIVIAQVDGEWTMKYYRKRGRQVLLEAANKKYQPIKPKEELVIGGVVIACIRKYAKR